MRCLTASIALCFCAFSATLSYGQSSIDQIAKTRIFAFGGVGFAGATSRGELEFRKIVTEPRETSIADFEKLYATGNAQAKSYALAGFWKLDRKRFDEIATSLSSSDT